LPDAVDVDADARQTTNVERWCADAAALWVRDEVRHHDREVLAALDTAQLELFGRERLNGEGRALEIRRATSRRHDDLLELRRSAKR
jgi:hypothetical protein